MRPIRALALGNQNPPKPQTLIIDDEPQLRKVYAKLLGYEGHNVTEAATGADGLSKAHAGINLILCDVRLPDRSGIDLLPELKQRAPLAPVIMLTAYGTIADGVEAMRRGAFDYLTKGDSDAQLLVRVAQALASVQARVAAPARFTFSDLTGTAPAYQRAISMAKAIAATDAAVLLSGPTGSGKELFAQSIQSGSGRSGKALVTINCAALPREMLESELFGHAKGAFTGAAGDKKGLVEEAHNGTLFLDEIGELPLDLQPKLLRFLETGQFYRMGDIKPRQVDVRLISATNRHLNQESQQGRFRADLYYRLSVLEITLPGLAERGGEDIERLANHYLTLFADKYHRKPTELSTSKRLQLLNHAWPGNVRELRNTMERIVLLGFEQAMPEVMAPSTAVSKSKHAAEPEEMNLAAMERKLIGRALAYTHGNKTQAAKVLGIGLTTLYRKVEELGIASTPD